MTRVIASAVEAMAGHDVEMVVLSSTEPEEEIRCPCVVVPALAYTETASSAAAQGLGNELHAQAERALGGAPDLWHVHNHCLGKNVNFPEALRGLLSGGAAALLQIHDFAEDGRPGNFKSRLDPYNRATFAGYASALYPDAPQIGYAVLNGRDHAILSEAGVPDERLFSLPNAVTAPSPQAETPESGGRPLFLYPTRAIRRKNLGEIVLMAALYPEFRFATTLSPKNPQWAGIYEGWVRFAQEAGIPAEFALGERQGNSFPQLLAQATAIVTTSVGEGFGLAFLEPWLFGKPLYGRDLPEITGDFRENGIRLPGLYAQWPVPLELFDHASLLNRYTDALVAVYADYGRSITRQAIADDWQQRTSDGFFDFGFLDETAQEEVLRGAVADPRTLRRHAPLQPDRFPAAVIPHNARIVRDFYGTETYGRKLEQAYRSLLEARPGTPRSLDPDRILDAFLAPRRFNLLRT